MNGNECWCGHDVSYHRNKTKRCTRDGCRCAGYYPAQASDRDDDICSCGHCDAEIRRRLAALTDDAVDDFSEKVARWVAYPATWTGSGRANVHSALLTLLLALGVRDA